MEGPLCGEFNLLVPQEREDEPPERCADEIIT
jgi:hypothetical protein